MMYRYLSAIYQTGDLAALNYVKGYLDGKESLAEPERILTVSGHDIGEAEMWLAERYPDAIIDTISFRLIDTQLLQFLRAAESEDIESVFQQFESMISAHPVLQQLASDRGLIPYWCEQAEAITRNFEQHNVTVYSVTPMSIPPTKTYDLIYVSHGSRYFSMDAAAKLRQHLSDRGQMAVLLPNRRPPRPGLDGQQRRFAQLETVREAKTHLREQFEQRGYDIRGMMWRNPEMDSISERRELIRFNVLAPASAVLIGELIVGSLYEHISDKARLDVLNETASHYQDFDEPVYEELELYIIGGDPS